jgi:hypothetical protein
MIVLKNNNNNMNYKTVIFIFLIGVVGLFFTQIEFPFTEYDSVLLKLAFFFSLGITFTGIALMMVKFVHYERLLKKRMNIPEKQKAKIASYLNKDYLGEPE